MCGPGTVVEVVFLRFFGIKLWPTSAVKNVCWSACETTFPWEIRREKTIRLKSKSEKKCSDQSNSFSCHRIKCVLKITSVKDESRIFNVELEPFLSQSWQQTTEKNNNFFLVHFACVILNICMLV